MLNSLLWGEDPEIRVKISAGSLHQQWGWQTPQLKSSFNSRCVVCPLWLVAPQPGHRMIPVFMDSWMTTSPLKMLSKYCGRSASILVTYSHIGNFTPHYPFQFWCVCLLQAVFLTKNTVVAWKNGRNQKRKFYTFSVFSMEAVLFSLIVIIKGEILYCKQKIT